MKEEIHMTENMNDIPMREYKVGDTVTGRVTKIEDKQVYVSIPDSKADGIIPISELSPLHIEKPADVVQEGDELQLAVIKVEEDLLILSKRRIDAEKAWTELQEKFEKGEAVEGEIKDIVKGGLVVDLGVRGFVPASQVEDHYVEDFSGYVGRTLPFKIIELDKEKNRLILSHREVVLEEKLKQKKERLESLKAGDIVTGTVRRITDFGVFVDIGGIDGLIHISQLSHQHVEHPSEVVSVNDEIRVKVLSVDPEKEKISLSLKETTPGPWENISEKFSAGSVVEGTVKRIVSFGAFVELIPGVEGLVHISQISNKHIGTPREVLSEGDKVKVKILKVDEENKRISLSIREAEEKAEETEYEIPQESKGFQIGEILGDKLKEIQ
jgi:small subunit ribosomal protein S1